jgi:outer membrane immunogenic protein
MRRLVLCTMAAAAFAATSSVQAADLPTKAPILKAPAYADDPWTGFYVGANLGYGFGSWGNSNPTSVGNSNFFNGTGLTNSADPNLDGWLAGGQIGYNWLLQNWVFGLEADFDWSDENASNGGSVSTTAPFFFGRETQIATISTSNSWNLDWLATVRARGGILLNPQLLLYGTGGLALGGSRYSNSTSTTSTITTLGGNVISGPTTTAAMANGQNATRVGWTIGAGIEQKVTKNWSAKLEYIYVDLGSYTFLSGTGADTNVNLHSNIVRVGLNYTFNK